MKKTANQDILICGFCAQEITKTAYGDSAYWRGEYVFHNECHSYACYPEEELKKVKELPGLIAKFKKSPVYKELKKRGSL